MTHPDCDGLLVIDKPAGMTSRDVVNRAQKWFPRRTRIGHTGTLDPLATGVLVLCVGAATRLTEYVQRMPKVYRASMIFGAVSDTDDADGRIAPTLDARMPSREEIETALRSFLGEIEQVPPAFSAAKVTGRRAYDLARTGQTVTLAPRKVFLYSIDLVRYGPPLLELQVRCGKGTYIRSLARDLGHRLGCGGYITSLRRLEVGCFHEAMACSLKIDADEARRHLLPIALAVSELPRITLPRADAARILHGGSVPLPPDWQTACAEAALFDPAGRLLAVVDLEGSVMLPGKVLVGASEANPVESAPQAEK